jgi:ATP-dependent DNA helicase RecQ
LVTVAERALELLRQALGDEAEFRSGQLEAILELVESRRRVLVVERTGWGKSSVYFIATKLLREQGGGPTFLISPLLALMRDQVRTAERLGVNAVSIDSTNKGEWKKIEEQLARDEIDLLLLSPERLANNRFRTKTVPSVEKGIGLFVVDEAHCISDWGHDFRPDYRRIKALTANLPPGVPLLATTATANDRVVADVADQLGPDLVVIRGALSRDSLYMQVVKLGDQAERLAWLVGYLRTVKGSGIVYTLTVADALRVSSWLGDHGIDAPAYFGGLDTERRTALERRLLDNEVKALVSTVALGMGFDKPDLGFVVHFQRPSSVIAYYQQIGRAGRALERAEVVLLTGVEDDDIAEFFIAEAFPPEDIMRAILSETEPDDGATRSAIEAKVNAKPATVERGLKLLEVDGAIVRDGAKAWHRTPNPWQLDAERIDAVTAARHRELDRMREFVDTDECLMAFVTGELDGPDRGPCGRCANCAGPFALSDADPTLVGEANIFLKRAYVPIDPRKMWGRGTDGKSKRIPLEAQLEEGLTLSRWGAAGWGAEVRRGKHDERFSDALVDAVAEIIETELNPAPAPTWVTSVPSRRHEMVPDFARRLAERLGLPYRSVLTKTHETPPQKTMENGRQQEQNVIDTFAADDSSVEQGSVLLVDDVVDSGWTLTACGVALREAGSGPVYPVALADTSVGTGP